MQAIKTANFHKTSLDEATVKLLEHAKIVTQEPAMMTRDDINALRNVGFSDEAILDATSIAAYFNYINRMSDALGVELEPVA